MPHTNMKERPRFFLRTPKSLLISFRRLREKAIFVLEGIPIKQSTPVFEVEIWTSKHGNLCMCKIIIFSPQTLINLPPDSSFRPKFCLDSCFGCLFARQEHLSILKLFLVCCKIQSCFESYLTSRLDQSNESWNFVVAEAQVKGIYFSEGSQFEGCLSVSLCS